MGDLYQALGACLQTDPAPDVAGVQEANWWMEDDSSPACLHIASGNICFPGFCEGDAWVWGINQWMEAMTLGESNF